MESRSSNSGLLSVQRLQVRPQSIASVEDVELALIEGDSTKVAVLAPTDSAILDRYDGSVSHYRSSGFLLTGRLAAVGKFAAAADNTCRRNRRSCREPLSTERPEHALAPARWNWSKHLDCFHSAGARVYSRSFETPSCGRAPPNRLSIRFFQYCACGYQSGPTKIRRR